MYKVSVIIPVYNGEKYIEDCLISVVNQTLKDIQIICVNDGSTDNTENILKDFASKDNRILIINTENKGQGSARNTALKESKGEYISFIDADDWIDENALEYLYFKAKSEDLDLLFYQMINFINSTERFIETDLYDHRCFEKNFLSENTIFNHMDTRDFLFEIPVCPVSKLYKKEFLDINHIKFPEGILFEDNAFFYNSFFKCEKAGFLKKHFYFRRRHDDSVTQRFDKKKFDIVNATNKVLETFIENNQYEKYKKEVINHTFSMIMEWFKKSPLELKGDFYRFIKTEFYAFNNVNFEKHNFYQDFKKFLKEQYSLIFYIMNEHRYYLDFLAEYKLATVDYEIFDNGLIFSLNSEKYEEYKLNLSKDYKISVIIPIFNNDTLIKRTLMSIENQSLGVENLEVLMINDASTDNTKEVINDYAEKYDGFKAIHIKEGTGSPGTPRNIGLLEASSDYVIFLDHDDYFEIDALEILYSTITKNSCDFVYGTYASVDGGLATKIVYPNEYHGYFDNIKVNLRAIAFPPPSIWTKLFKRSFLIENHILFPTILGEDAIFVSKALFEANGINYLWNDLICYHDLNKKSSTKNVSYEYLVEGFVSEEYIYKIYEDYEQNANLALKNNVNSINFSEKNSIYKIRAEGILDFYLNQFYSCYLNENEIKKIFSLLENFVKRVNKLGIKPHVFEHNNVIFNYVLENNIDSLINFKNENNRKIEESKKIFNQTEIKNFIKMASIKTKTYPYLKKINQKLRR